MKQLDQAPTAEQFSRQWYALRPALEQRIREVLSSAPIECRARSAEPPQGCEWVVWSWPFLCFHYGIAAIYNLIQRVDHPYQKLTWLAGFEPHWEYRVISSEQRQSIAAQIGGSATRPPALQPLGSYTTWSPHTLRHAWVPLREWMRQYIAGGEFSRQLEERVFRELSAFVLPDRLCPDDACREEGVRFPWVEIDYVDPIGFIQGTAFLRVACHSRYQRTFARASGGGGGKRHVEITVNPSACPPPVKGYVRACAFEARANGMSEDGFLRGFDNRHRRLSEEARKALSDAMKDVAVMRETECVQPDCQQVWDQKPIDDAGASDGSLQRACWTWEFACYPSASGPSSAVAVMAGGRDWMPTWDMQTVAATRPGWTAEGGLFLADLA